MACVETRRGSIPLLQRCVASSVDMLGWSVGSAISPFGCDSRGNLLCFNICACPRGIKAKEGNSFTMTREEALVMKAGVSRAGART